MRRFIDPNDNFRPRPPLSPERVGELNKQLAEQWADYNKRFQQTWDEENAHWKAMNNDTANQNHPDPVEAAVGEDGQAPAKLDRS